MVRSLKRGCPEDECKQGSEECCVCLSEVQGHDRTVDDGAPHGRHRVHPFNCIHWVCDDCESSLVARGDGRCPLCRSERETPLENDARSSPGGILVSGAILTNSGTMIFPVTSGPEPLSSAHALAMALRFASEERLFSQSLEASDADFELEIEPEPEPAPAPAPAQTNSSHQRIFTRAGVQVRRADGRSSHVPLSHGARQLVRALTRVADSNIEDFRRRVAQQSSRSTPAQSSVRVHPQRW